MSIDLQSWVRASDWPRVLQHFTDVAPRTAAEFASRGLAIRALQPGVEGARQALPDLRQALALQPGSAPMASNLLQGLIDAGETREACLQSAALVAQSPHDADLRHKQVQALMAAARWDDALEAASVEPAARDARPPWAALRDELGSRWWQPVILGGQRLRQPQPQDRGFVARCFRDRAFMSRYHRYQAGEDAAIEQFIARSSSRPQLTRRLDWVVCRGDEAIGLTSLVDIDPDNRRAELLVGFPHPRAAASAALKASLAAMQFAFDRLGLHKLMSYVYGDNAESQANTLHLGLHQEGLLREHLQVDGQPLDLYVNGLLAPQFHADERLQRLLQRWTARPPQPEPAGRPDGPIGGAGGQIQ